MPGAGLSVKSVLAGVLALLVATLLSGCERTPPQSALQLTDITGAEFGRGFSLTDHNGRARTLADFRGKVVAVFFGFTHCPDVCPTTLAELAQVMRELGPDAKKVQVLFITVDPERDTPEVLRQYVPSFDPSFLGLYGDTDAIARTAKDFKVFYQKQALPGGGYSVDHSAGMYIYDREGRLRLYASYGRGAAALLHDIRILLGAS
jgi:protein SCO1/2